MVPSDLLSVNLFKKSVAEYLPDYILVHNDVVLKTIQRALDNNYNIEESVLILSKDLDKNQVDLPQVLDDFLSELADFYVQTPNLLDPIIEQLFKLGHTLFLMKIEDTKELQIAIQRSERKRLKKLLLAIDEQQEAEEIRAAFQRIERKEKKENLQRIENGQQISNTTQKINWRFVMRIAALFILVLIPVGISIFFFNGGSESVTNGRSKNKKEDNNIIYAETGDLTELKDINIPAAVYSLGSTILETDEQGFGFAQEEEKISINLISFKNQIAYLDNKIQSIESKYDELKSKKIKQKKSTLQSLIEVKEKCFLKKKELLALEATYEFKKDKLKLFKQEKIDLKSIKVYSLSESDDQKIFYLKIGEDYFDLSKSKGKLKKVVDPDIIEQLDDI
jgi:hypothetical protein